MMDSYKLYAAQVYNQLQQQLQASQYQAVLVQEVIFENLLLRIPDGMHKASFASIANNFFYFVKNATSTRNLRIIKSLSLLSSNRRYWIEKFLIVYLRRCL